MNLNHFASFFCQFCYSIKAASMHSGAESAKEEFVPSHWDARDTMNDTAWITHWIQGRFGGTRSGDWVANMGHIKSGKKQHTTTPS
jgi:hypothetical protein